jgi:hypothetical protein
MGCIYNDPLHAVPTKMMLESFPMGERLRMSKQSAMNFQLPKQIVSP